MISSWACDEKMIVHLAYGKSGLDIELPSSTEVLTAAPVPAIPDPHNSLLEALRKPIGSSPLRELVRPQEKIVIVHTDLTRATPNTLILPVLLEELESAGARRENITLLNALGTHRRQTETELRELLGDSIVDNYRCIQHDAWDDFEPGFIREYLTWQSGSHQSRVYRSRIKDPYRFHRAPFLCRIQRWTQGSAARHCRI